ncbi:flagellar filament capping protein FliD [Nocardioides pacificus]
MASIGGLSGFDGAAIVDQLMPLEAIPQNRLKTQQASQRSTLSALQQLNTRIATLGSAATTLAKAETWQGLKATSSSSQVTVTAGASAAATNFTVGVTSVATAHQVSFSFAAKTDAPAVTTGPMRLDFTDPTKSPITLTTDGTLQGLADAINDTDNKTGLTATVVRTGAAADGSAQYGLVVTADKTGAASGFTLSYDDAGGTAAGTPLAQQAPGARIGTDAAITLGAGLTLTSATNTFADVAPGVSITIADNAVTADKATAASPQTISTVTVKQDPTSLVSSVKGLVDQLNTALGWIDEQTAGAKGAAKAGTLAGDATARSVRSALLNTVFGSGNTTMAGMGIQTDRAGKLVFDEAKFKEAYAADPAAVAAQFTKADPDVPGSTNGWAARLEIVSKAASDPTTGTVTGAVKGRESTIDRLQNNIDSWDLRLELRRTTLSRQFNALEVALSNMNSQSSWLAGQINSLPSYSSR